MKFILWSTDGRVRACIKGVVYEYMTDAGFHYRWKRMAKRRPFKALNEIKKVAISYGKVRSY